MKEKTYFTPIDYIKEEHIFDFLAKSLKDFAYTECPII